MLTQPPADLIAAVKEGRVVLLLGAGASYGATDDKGQDIPLGKAVAAELVKQFLSPEYAGLDFRAAYDLSCGQRDVRTVQKYIHDRLFTFGPANYHLLIPTFAWAGLLTTNYDLVIERAYAQGEAAQRLVPNVEDADDATSRLDSKSVLYVKLHGCITRYDEVHPPLIANTEQLIAFRSGRIGQFDTFLEWSRNKTIVFVGYSFGDLNLRVLLDEVVKEGDNRPRHYIVDPNILPAVADYWRDRRFISLKMNFEQFLTDLDKVISSASRTLSSLNVSLAQTTFTKYITVSGQRESDELSQYIKFGINHICEGFIPEPGDPKRFYKGFNLEWYPFMANLDVRRTPTDDILSDHIISRVADPKAQLVVLKGHAGSGKSVTLRRVCWEAAFAYKKLCFFVSRDATIRLDLFDDIFKLTNNPIFLFVDGLGIHSGRIRELLELAKQRRITLTIIGTESFNTWNTSCENLERYVVAEYEMRRLSGGEVDKLIEKLADNDSLGSLAALSKERRREEFMVAYGRQILVALLEATHGLPFIEIISNEYKSIFPPKAQLLYLDICSLHRFGPPVRAGLISRVHQITFDQFETEFFRPLEQIVHLKKDPKSGDYVYQARHPQIADALYEAVLKSQEERFDNMSRILGKLNPSYSYDLEVLAKIIRAENVARTLSDTNRARQIYEIALEKMGKLTVIIHQRGIYELRIANDLGALRNAASYLEEAVEQDPRNRSIKHSLAELDLKRSRVSTDPLERITWRREAVRRSSELTIGDSSSYPYHTILKAAIDEVTDSLQSVDEGESETSVRQLGDSIAKAEDTLKRGLQKFPNDERLLSAEGDLAKVLSNSARAEGAFQKAFNANPRSTLVARRLVRILRAKEENREAVNVLTKALEANPSNQELHLDLALALIAIAPDADQTDSETVLYHLRRSFAPGDKNYYAQFWFARQLCISGRYDDAVPIFSKLWEMSISFSRKSMVQGFIKDSNGENIRFRGKISVFRHSFAFVESQNPKLSAFISAREIDLNAESRLAAGSSISFEIGFNFRGPVAISVKLFDLL